MKSFWSASWKPFVPAFLWVIADRGLKYWTLHQLTFGERRGIGWGFFLRYWLTHRSEGGLSGSWNLWQFPLLIWCLLFLTACARYRRATPLERTGYALLLSCGLSNLWDVWRSHAAVTSLEMVFGQGTLLSFNLADFGVSLSATLLTVLLALRLMRDSSRPRSQNLGFSISRGSFRR